LGEDIPRFGISRISSEFDGTGSSERAGHFHCRRPFMSKLSIRAKVIAVIAFMLVAMSGMGLLAIRSSR
jgi:hypothetical protein